MQSTSGTWFLRDLSADVSIRLTGNFERILPFANDMVAVQVIRRGETMWYFENINNLIDK